MNYASRIAGAAVAALLLSGFASAALGQGAPPQGVPLPKILIVDRSEVLGRSNVGASIMAQVRNLATQAENGLKARDAALRQEGGALQQQLAILAPGIKAAKIKAFEAKQAALQADVQKQQNLIQGGLMVAREQVARALQPILQKIMTERGANLLLDRSLVVIESPQMDITAVAIQRLNQALPNVKVSLAPMPAQPGAPPQR